MTPDAYQWDSEAELVTAQPEDAAIYYEWLLRLPAGARPGEALSRIGVRRVRQTDAGRPGWIPAFFVDDVHAAIDRLEPGSFRVEVADGGGLYVFDQQGLAVILREPGNEPGSVPRQNGLTFDCSALDVAESASFYSRLLDLDTAEVADDVYAMRFLLNNDGIVAGVLQLHGVENLNHTPVWITYFEVDSVEESVTRAVQSGSRVRIPPANSPLNRYAVLDDPWGNLYGFSSLFTDDWSAESQDRETAELPAQLR